MSCDLARERLSAAQDSALADVDRAGLEAHLDGCASCRAHRAQLQRLRRAMRYEPLGQTPDVAPAVVAAVATGLRRRRWRGRLGVAAAFVAAALAGAAFVGLDVRSPPGVRAAVPDRVVEAQARLSSLDATVNVVERGWHPAVPERRYTGTLAYRAPESFALALADQTAYPDPGWVPNDVDVVADDDVWWARGPAPCPHEALPDCADPTPRVQAIVGREPFRAASPAPLDLVVPVRSFALAAEPGLLGERSIAGRDALGLVTTAAQVTPVLDGLRQAGTLRSVHPTDRVEIWLDEQALVPLALTVHADDSTSRARWAARRGYADEAGQAVLEITVAEVAVNVDVPDEAFPPPPVAAEPRDAGFVDQGLAQVDVPPPEWLPDGMRHHRAGVLHGDGDAPTVAVASWSDARAWVKVRATRDWAGGRLFGGLGDAVRQVRVGDGVGYVAQGGRAVALHTDGVDIVVAGSLPESHLRRVATSLGVRGEAVPASWAEAAALPVGRVADEVDQALLPPDLDGFAPATARLVAGGAVISVTGPGARGFVLTQVPGKMLGPPLEPDVQGVEVRGTAGRYTPGSGELEWVEAGQVVSLRSATLSLDEIVAVAQRLRTAP